MGRDVRTVLRAMGLAALLVLAAGCHATTGWDRGAPRAAAGGATGPVIVVPADAYARTVDHLGRRIPR